MSIFNHQSLTVIRGVPGSGKSTLAHTLIRCANYDAITTPPEKIYVPVLVEMDDWRTTADGKYEYTPERNREIAGFCFSRVLQLLTEKQSVIVANIFLKRAQIRDYAVLAYKMKVAYNEYITNSQHTSIHGVSRQAADGMRSRLEIGS